MPFTYEPTIQLAHDQTTYRKLETAANALTSHILNGKNYLHVSPDALRLLAREAFNDISFYLRPAHLARLREELDDPEASDNDRFVIYTHLQNAVTASAGLLPTCQDTGTAIVLAKKGQHILTTPTTPQPSRKASTTPTRKKTSATPKSPPSTCSKKKTPPPTSPPKSTSSPTRPRNTPTSIPSSSSPKAAAAPTSPTSTSKPPPSSTNPPSSTSSSKN